MLLDYTYRYDGNGNRTSKAGASNVSRHAGNDSSIGNTSYSYDSLQRLQEVSYPTGTVEKFAYDNAGNRILKKYGTADNFKTGSYLEERYRYDNKNRLLESRNPQNVTYYQYDKQGNTISELTKQYLTGENKEAQSVQYAAGMTEKQDSIMQEFGQQEVQHGNRTLVSHSVEKTELQQYKTYAYNSFNKASKVTVENYTNGEKAVDIHENFYDAENMRYSIKENGTTTNFVTNGWSVFTELDAEWKTTKRLVRGYCIVASEEVGTATITDVGSGYSNGYHYYHQNEHGDIEYITGKDGKIENAYTYDAFGNITNSTELVKNRYSYNGEQYDQVTQQYYLRARYYNPLVGRFTQEDVYRGDGLNLYAYCGNNPVMYVDPSGYEYIPELFDVEGTIPGTSSSTNLGENIFEHVGIDKNTTGTGSHQKQHIIPQEVYKNSEFLQNIGFQVDHHQNGIFDVNKNNSSNSVNEIFHDNGVSENLANRYISDSTHHNGYHQLYNEAVSNAVSDIEYGMKDYKEKLLSEGLHSEVEVEKIVKRESRKQVHSLLEDLRTMNKNGIDLYKNHNSNEKQYRSQSDYEVYFNEKLKSAHEENQKKKCC